MTCNEFQECLNASRTDLSFSMLQHRMGCPQCRAYQKRLDRQHRLARRLARPAVPVELRARVLERLPEEAAVPIRPRTSLFLRSALALGIGAVTLAGIWIAQSRLVTPPAFAVEVKSAIQHANTWHFVGWRKEGGKKITWEIWGRRQPFFYREQIGDDILIDNGVSRLRLLPPDRFQKKGYAISLPSESLSAGLLRGSSGSRDPGQGERFIEGIGGDYLEDLSEKSRDARQVVFFSIIESGVTQDEPLMTVDRYTHLPVSYRLERKERAMLPSRQFADSYGATRTVANLTMAYGVTIPTAMESVPIPASFQTIDAHEGLDLRPQVLERDAHGNIHIKVEHWLAGKRLTVGHIFPWFETNVNLQCPPYTQPWEAQYPTDDSGQRYLPIPSPANVHDSYRTDIWLVPLDPIEPGSVAAPPRSLSLPVVADLSFDKGVPDPYVTAIWTTVPILSKTTTLSVALPGTPSKSLPYDNQPTTPGLMVSLPVMPLAFEEARARYHYYRSEIGENSGISPRNNPVPARKALYWLDRAITTGATTPLPKAHASDRAQLLSGMREDAQRLRQQLGG